MIVQKVPFSSIQKSTFKKIKIYWQHCKTSVNKQAQAKRSAAWSLPPSAAPAPRARLRLASVSELGHGLSVLNLVLGSVASPFGTRGYSTVWFSLIVLDSNLVWRLAWHWTLDIGNWD